MGTLTACLHTVGSFLGLQTGTLSTSVSVGVNCVELPGDTENRMTLMPNGFPTPSRQGDGSGWLSCCVNRFKSCCYDNEAFSVWMCANAMLAEQ